MFKKKRKIFEDLKYFNPINIKKKNPEYSARIGKFAKWRF